ncbi:MAG: aromatic acid exporter family protein [Traorella sp.]
MKKRWIGSRILKTAIAVMLAIFISQLLQSEYPFFAGMTALISMDKTSGNSLKMGRNRVVGTIIGAMIGIGLSYLDRGNILLCGLGIVLLILICNKLNLQGSITIGGIVMLAIMVHTDKSPLFYGFHRSVDTLIGAIVSILVNISLSPYISYERLENMTIQLWDETDKLVDALKKHETVDTHIIKEEMKIIEEELKVYHTELFMNKRREWVNKLQKHYDMATHLVLELEILETIDQQIHPDIFDYHVKAALDIYELYVSEFQVKKVH